MTLKYLSVLITILFIACNSGENTIAIKDSSVIKDTTKKKEQTVSNLDKKAKPIDSTKLMGIWTDGNSENASFDIRKDSIYYVDQFASYKYLFNADSIKIFYSDWAFNGAVSFFKDTLLITSEDGTTKYWKFVN